MRKKVKQSKTLLIVIVVGIVILAIAGVLITYALNRMRDVTPSSSEATTCCICDWSLTTSDGTKLDLGTTVGSIQNNQCVFLDPNPSLGNYKPTTCSDVDVEDVFDTLPSGVEEGDLIETEERRDQCTGGCISNTSSPLLPPDEITDDNADVTFSTYFELRYAIDSNDEFTDAEIIFDYPTGQDPPKSVPSTTLEFIGERNENNDPNLKLKVYEATFDTTWDTVMNSAQPGTYTVKFRAKDETGSWTETTNCARAFVVTEDEETGEYCYSIDVVPVKGSGPLDVTLTCNSGVPEGEDATYEWKLDLNCSGEYDEGTGEDAEQFTTTSDTSITRTFTYPDGETGALTCPVEVLVKVEDGSRTLQDLKTGSCDGSVTLTQVPETCGDGECNSGETCDPDGNLDCPSGDTLSAGTVCRADCSYCGDGTIDSSEEECDPGIEEDETGYEELCDADCTIGTTGPAETPETGSETESLLVITQETTQCLEMVSPNNVASISITVTNSDTTEILIRAISDTLPQGMAYVTGSSSVNSIANATDEGITTETSGSSQLITWDNNNSGWTIPAGDSLILAFQATVNETATTGTHANSVTVTPADQNPIPSEGSILIAQVCTQPETGIFGRNTAIIFIGSIFLVVAGAAFYTGFGTREAAFLAEKSSNLYLRLSRPQKYMEQKIQGSALKNIDRHTKHSKKSKGRKK